MIVLVLYKWNVILLISIIQIYIVINYQDQIPNKKLEIKQNVLLLNGHFY